VRRDDCAIARCEALRAGGLGLAWRHQPSCRRVGGLHARESLCRGTRRPPQLRPRVWLVSLVGEERRSVRATAGGKRLPPGRGDPAQRRRGGLLVSNRYRALRARPDVLRSRADLRQGSSRAGRSRQGELLPRQRPHGPARAGERAQRRGRLLPGAGLRVRRRCDPRSDPGHWISLPRRRPAIRSCRWGRPSPAAWIEMNRREFLRSLGSGTATAALLHKSLARAAALPAIGRSGTLEDVEHVVVFMLENRSFDHYFGHLSGVRGYNDRLAVRLAGGKPVWFQPRMRRPDQPILPFHLDTRRSSAQLLQDLDHSWDSQHGAISAGRMDAWPLNKTDMTMGYFLREDIPFHYALADAFTICDHYFCSIAGPTCPNRTMLWTGSIDPEGTGGGPFIDDAVWIYTKGVKPFAWTTYAERLQGAGITWQVYQEALEEVDDDPMTGNFHCNALAYFKPFADAAAGSELRRRAMSAGGVGQLREDVLEERLPQVSWIVMPAGYSEHPSYPPAYGAMYVARVLEALTANPKVWGKTVLLLNYDENDGFFDHMVPPQPPTPVLPGISTVSTAGEIHDI